MNIKNLNYRLLITIFVIIHLLSSCENQTNPKSIKIKESDSVNEYGFTKEEMKKIVNSVKKEVSEYYKGLKDRVKTLEVETERMKNISLKHLSVENQETIFKGYIEPKSNQEVDDVFYKEVLKHVDKCKVR
jgi:hypothetical protein